jgi:hypothetical protein
MIIMMMIVWIMVDGYINIIYIYKWVPAETRIYAYKNIRVYFYVVFMCVFLSAPAETRCVNKRVLTCINAYSRIFTRRVSKKIATKKQSTNASENAS